MGSIGAGSAALVAGPGQAVIHLDFPMWPFDSCHIV